MPRPRKYKWRITWSKWATKELDGLLGNGWEPFGATEVYVWLRKRALIRETD